MKKIFSYLSYVLRGMLMGAADIVPGVSGGTIALLTGIYTRLISAIKSINLLSLKLFFTGKWKKFWEEIDGGFLLSVLAGIAISLFTLAKGVEYLLEHYPLQIWSFFSGLVVASVVIVLMKIKKWNFLPVLLFLAGGAGAWFLVGMSPVSTPDNLLFVFLSGVIAITAMILPGISGSLILVLLGKYSTVLNAVTELNFLYLGVFIAGAVVGIVGFSRILGFLLKKWWDLSIAVLAGFMAGSLNKLWPWKETLETFIDRHGVVQPLIQRNILPGTFHNITGENPYLLSCIICCLVGLLFVAGIEFLAVRFMKRDSSDQETPAE